MNDYFGQVDWWFKTNARREKINHCIICNYYHDEDIDMRPKTCRYQKEDIFVKCPECGFVWNFYAPDPESLRKFYEDSIAMKTWTSIKKGAQEIIRQREKYDYCWRYVKDNQISSVLDVGCGDGFFLNELDSSIKKVGIDPCENYSQSCGFPVYKDAEHFRTSMHGSQKYQMITMFGVLEHVKDPLGTINLYKEWLEPKGVIAIIVPNAKSLVSQVLGTECSTFCPQHLWHFDIITLQKMFEKTGMEAIHAHSFEAETQPILKKLRGLNPYMDLGFALTDKDIYEENILKAGKGYKIFAIFRRLNA
jgi:SAM-dependent methyltransferase